MNANALAVSGELKRELERPPVRLYEIVTALNAIEDLLEQNGGELSPDIEAALDALEGGFEAKVDNICTLRQNLLADAQMVQAEVDRLKARAESSRRKAASLLAYLHTQFTRAGRDKLKTPRFSTWVQANPVTVRWTRELTDLPEGFARITIEPNKEKAREVLRTGGTLPDGFEVVQGTHLRIR